MANCTTYNDFLKYWQGQTQHERYLVALNPANIDLMPLQVEDWMDFAVQLAPHISFFEGENIDSPKGNWQSFWQNLEGIKEDICDYKEGSISPHLALYICFLKLLNNSRNSFNNITKRHLDFYYREVLQIKKKQAVEDQVYGIVELAKNTNDYLLQQGVALDGAKDDIGRKRHYVLEDEIVINKASIQSVKKSLITTDNWYAEAIDTWTSTNSFALLASDKQATFGFAISSPCLNVIEEVEALSVVFSFNRKVPSFGIADWKIEASTADGWHEIMVSKSENDRKKWTVQLSISNDTPPFAIYDANTHGKGYTTTSALLRFVWKGNSDSFAKYKRLSRLELTNIILNTTEKYKETLNVKNDNGVVDTTNTFYPFGALAKQNAKLLIGADGLWQKKITKATLGMEWQNGDVDLNSYYKGYGENGGFDIVFGGLYQRSVMLDSSKTQQKAQRNSSFEQQKAQRNSSFEQKNTEKKLDSLFYVNAGQRISSEKKYAYKLVLKGDFLHDEYPKLMMALATKGTIAADEVPNVPLIPTANGISLTVDCEDSLNASIDVFHVHPFGAIEYSSKGLCPKVNTQGELYLGIQDVTALQSLQLLFQLEEGTEDPNAFATEETNSIEWYYLRGNSWNSLKEYMLKDETNNMLQSGLVKFIAPIANSESTLFEEEELLWIKVVKNGENAASQVCLANGIHTQAVKGKFLNRQNSLTHLASNLPKETISHLVNKVSSIKKVEQPYPSFGGKAKEKEVDYYRRVSERLRHKDRAITAWDYEHLLLEGFDYLYKVKCLNHTSLCSYQSPGNVVVVALPDMSKIHVFDVLQPQLSRAKLSQMESYVVSRSGLLVNTKVISPTYDHVKVELKVRFKEGYDIHFYVKQLQDDITKYLAPWAYDANVGLVFNNQIYYSQLVAYIESLSYVQYSKDVVLKVNEHVVKHHVVASNPRSILTSVPKDLHIITPIESALCE